VTRTPGLSGHADLSLPAAINEGGFSIVGTIQGRHRFIDMRTLGQMMTIRCLTSSAV
jgi:hypothetical protein